MAINGEKFLQALEELEASKGISKEVVLQALKEAMIKGYKKQIGATEEDDCVRVTIDPDTGAIDMYQFKKVVEEVEDDFLEITVEEANALDKSKKYKVGDEFIIPSSPDELTKAVAINIKGVLKQKLSDAEKNVLFEAFKDKIGTMITGKVEKVDERGLSINIGRTSVYLPKNQMIGDERFLAGDSIKLYVNSVASGSKGAHIIVSRANEGFLKCLFFEEINEIYNGTITIKGIAREAGERSKVAVYTEDPNVDPAGACIGPNGSRIQKIVGQLGNGQAKEKIDIITYSDVTGLYIIEALKPAKVVGISVDEENKSALAVVKDDSYSLAIGKKGVNVRLAVRLTGFNIDIKTETQAEEEGLEYQLYEDLVALDAELKSKKAYEKLAAQYQQPKEESTDVLPGLPEGYVAPQERVYKEESNEELEEALQTASEKEEAVEEVREVVKEEVKEAQQPKVEEEKQSVKTTTSIEDLEKSLSEESNKQKDKGQRRNKNKKKEESEEESSKGALDTSSAERMSIYTEEELREMEKEEQEEDDYEEEDVDYDEYDEYYDDDDR